MRHPHARRSHALHVRRRGRVLRWKNESQRPRCNHDGLLQTDGRAGGPNRRLPNSPLGSRQGGGERRETEREKRREERGEEGKERGEVKRGDGEERRRGDEREERRERRGERN